jgi:hypothetical protein
MSGKKKSPYILFASEMRPKIKEENPGIKFGPLGKKLGQMWRELSPEERAKYGEKAKGGKDKKK